MSSFHPQSLLCLHSRDIRSGWCLSKVVHRVKVQLGWPIHQQRSYSSLGTAPVGDAQSKNNLFSPPANLLTWFPSYPPVPFFVGPWRISWPKFCSCIYTDDACSCSPKGLKVNRKRGYSLITYLSKSIHRSNLWVVECWRVPSQPSHCHVATSVFKTPDK